MFTFYEVGGKVRDEFLGLENKDIDYVAVPDKLYGETVGVVAAFDSLKNYLEVEGYQLFLVTPEMYTIRAKFPKGHIHEGTVADFVLARKEIGYEKGTRRPIVVPGTLLDDLTRRDFTVNAIAKSITGEIIDPFDGIGDIKNKILRTPISGKITFDDDPLRLLRAIRFAVTKGFKISEEISKIIEEFDYENKFYVVSEERIREELHKCFKYNTIDTLYFLTNFSELRCYIFNNTNLWLMPTNRE